MFSFPEVKYDADPFPHCVVRGAWSEDMLRAVKADCDNRFLNWSGEKTDPARSIRKKWCNEWDGLPSGVSWSGNSVRELIQFAHEPAFLRWLEKTTGESGLLPDPYLRGGGIHRISRGGYLKMHTDFNYDERLKLYRRLNVLLYLNKDWKPEWGGYLSLAGRIKIAPEANTMVVFTTDDMSWHGHPDPLGCPEGVYRDSIALYYYAAEQPKRNFAKARLNTTYL